MPPDACLIATATEGTALTSARGDGQGGATPREWKRACAQDVIAGNFGVEAAVLSADRYPLLHSSAKDLLHRILTCTHARTHGTNARACTHTGGLRKRASKQSEKAQPSVARDQENVDPTGKDSSPQYALSLAVRTDASLVAMWERSVRDIFAALADEDGSRTFGFRVTADKNPKDGDLPAVLLPPSQCSLARRSRFVPAGTAMPADPEFRLSAVNGEQVCGKTAQEIKDMVKARRLLLKLDVVTDEGKRKERRVVWCR